MKVFWVLLSVLMYVLSSVRASKECGPRLEKALDDVCNQFFYSPPSKKSALQDEEYDTNSLSENLLELFGGGPFKSTRSSFAARRRRRGIVEECCDKPCNEEHLRQYCLQSR